MSTPTGVATQALARGTRELWSAARDCMEDHAGTAADVTNPPQAGRRQQNRARRTEMLGARTAIQALMSGKPKPVPFRRLRRKHQYEEH